MEQEIDRLLAKYGKAKGTLVGVKGTFAIIRHTVSCLRQAGLSDPDIRKVQKLSLSDDYDQVIAVCASLLNFDF